MLNQLVKRNYFTNTLGVVTAAILFSAASVHPQATSPSDTSSGSSAMGDQSQSSSPAKGNQGATGTTSSGASDTSGTTSSGASGTATTSSTAGKATVSTSDRNLMRDLASANLSEIALAKLAQSKASSEQVRNFAQRMVDDHTKAQDQLQQLAQAKGVQLPSEPDAKHKTQEKKLDALSGEAFDKQYMEQAGMTEHRNTHRLVSKISKSARDADLKKLGADLLPDIDQHMQMAQQMRSGKQAGQTSSGTSGTSGMEYGGAGQAPSGTSGKEAGQEAGASSGAGSK